jgi:hypothetical protein
VANTYFRWPATPNGIVTYANFAAFPASAATGSFALALDTDTLYVYNGGWIAIAAPGTILGVGTFDSGVASANGGHVDSNLLIFQSATATVPGLVNTGTQTFAGAKTFTGAISASNLSGTNTGNVTLGTASGLSIAGQVLSLGLASAGVTGALSGTDWSTFNGKQNALTFGALTDAGTDGITVTGGAGAVIGSGTSIAQRVADTTHNGYLSSTDWNTFNGKQAAGNYLTALTGDGTAAGPGSSALTLATVNSNVGAFGSASAVATFTVNGKGLTTAAGSTSIQIAESQVTNLVSDLAGKQATGNYITALTGDVTAAGPGSVAASLTATTNATLTTLSALTTASALVSVGTISTGTWSATAIAATRGGTGQTTWTLGDTLYSSASNVLSKLAGNTTSTKMYLSQTGTGSVSAAPAWAQVAFSDLSGSVAAAQMPALTGDVTTSAGAVATTIAANAVTNAKAAQMAGLTVKGNNTGSTANALDLTTTQVRALITKAPTYQIFTTGTAQTYTLPAGCSYIKVRMCGGGGGGAGSCTVAAANAGAGGNGVATTFSTLTANAGTGGSANAGAGTVSGGSGSVGAGASGFFLIGGPGQGPSVATTVSEFIIGGVGGANYFGGGGGVQANIAGGNGVTNTGSGGGGASGFGTTDYAGGGGGAGGYVEAVIAAPSGTYTYTVGGGGTAGLAGTSGLAGGTGAAGIIIVEEYYL